MLCEKCKVREANIKYTEIINGVKTEHNLCSHCAKEMDFGQYTALLDGEFPLGKLLSGLLGLEEDEEETDERFRVVCPTCGTSFDDFVQNSRFGCPDCYGVFDLFISDKIKQLQGSESHRGKIPKIMAGKDKEAVRDRKEEVPQDVLKEAENKTDEVSTDRPDWWKEAADLEKQLKDALKKEDYEMAAACRDKIRALKAGKDGHIYE
jgi:protein arginine kinase activator